MTTELDHERAALGRLAAGSNFADDVRVLRMALDRLADLSTPPADDVREALIDELSGTVTWLKRTQNLIDANRVMRAIAVLREVRPRGTVTDAEHREAVHRAVRAGIESVIRGTADRDLVRAVATHVLALEARS